MAVGRSLSPRSLGAALAALLLLAAPAPAPAAARATPRAQAAPTPPLAVLAAVKGKVQVTHASGQVRPGDFGQALERGDRIVVAAGGAATVFFNDGNVIELAERSSITVDGKVVSKPAAGPGRELSGEVYSRVTQFVTGGSAQAGLVALAPVRGTDTSAPILLAPRKTGLLTRRPAFSWRGVEGATRYRVSVSGDGGELWDREVKGLTLDYPADAESLAAGGMYTWELQALSDHGLLRKEESSIEVLKAEDAAQVRVNLDKIRDSAGGDSTATRFLTGSYLFGRELFDDAARDFEVLTRLSPLAAAAHKALGRVYLEQGLTDLASAELLRALELTRAP